MSDQPILLQLVQHGALQQGQELTCPAVGMTGLIKPAGIEVAGQIFSGPTAAMRAVTGTCSEADNGWVFWKLPDNDRGFTKPLEHVRIAWLARDEKSGVRTSKTHPLRIDTLQPPGLPGRIGLTFLPGKKGDALYGAPWDRDLGDDLRAIIDWGADAVVSLLEPHEFELLGVPDFPKAMSAQGFRWILLEVRDSDVPDSRFESVWPVVRPELIAILQRGGGIVVHCRGGLGRTGLVVSRLLVELGLEAEKAIGLVREVRPGAVETWEQEEYIRQLSTRPIKS